MEKFKTLTLPTSKILLAPLAGISSLAFRTINRQAGCKFAFLEMISARSLSYSSKKTIEMMQTNSSDRPLGVQLLGSDPKYILPSLEKLREYPYDLLDFNAACPQKKVTSNGKGAALLKEPKRLRDLLKILVKESPLPVTVKIRIGWDSGKNAVDIAKHAEDAGISALCIHGRTRMQGYRRPLDYNAIREVKKSLKIPVIASGEIWDWQLAKKMFDETGCDAITVARGSLGNPWIFKEIEEFLNEGVMPLRPSMEELGKTMKEHLNLDIEARGERTATIEFRKFFIWYSRGMRNIKPLRGLVGFVKTQSQMVKLIEKLIATGQQIS
mgnify:CR=1 FL=1|tara:strand:+ start:2601 stop:3578 length:978 start_codon:yes stop_codon:yes gene_type:complete